LRRRNDIEPDVTDAGDVQGREAMTTATIDHDAAPAARPTARRPARALQMMQAEFVEMPGLALTLRQATRLWALDERETAALLAQLVDTGFLVQTPRGLYRRRGTPRCC
jgi:hypothetical protein